MKKFYQYILSIFLVTFLFTSCDDLLKQNQQQEEEESGTQNLGPEEFPEDFSFYSETPLTYSFAFSDASWYPLQETWKTEGVFKDIKELTNVTLDLLSFDSKEYNNEINKLLMAGTAPYIIAKIYQDNGFYTDGVVPVSDYTQYMPNFNAFVKKYKLEPELDTIRHRDGKFYRLPGMHQSVSPNYSLLVRDDIFAAAGYDIRELEKNWTWETLHDVLLEVKKYMVAQGMCTQDDYIWLDRWCGGESGKGNGGSLMRLMGASYNIISGWAFNSKSSVKWDAEKQEFYSTSMGEDFKKCLTVANSFVKDKLLDPASFSDTQTDDLGRDAFYEGKTVILSSNSSQFSTDLKGIASLPNASAYFTVFPSGSVNYTDTSGRLENGIMISKRALEELGEEDFITLIKFVDWLFYSSKAYSAYKWGPQGKTWNWSVENGVKVKKLLPGYKCGGLGFNGSDSDIDIRAKWGYAGGNFWYGHSMAELTDNFDAGRKDIYMRFSEYKTPLPPENYGITGEGLSYQEAVAPVINEWTLKFITGEKSITADWDAYIAACKEAGADELLTCYSK